MFVQAENALFMNKREKIRQNGVNNGERGGGANPAAVTGYPFWQSGVDRDVIIETAVVIFMRGIQFQS